ncbi:hypothetical protein J4410_00245 [Candidatus Woesearchaeota archaeon]|nr:hypothetical protein [Candidatus Woesearchaeota archaeon]
MKTDFFAGLGLGLILIPTYAFLHTLEFLGNILIVLFVLIGVTLLIFGYMQHEQSGQISKKK